MFCHGDMVNLTVDYHLNVLAHTNERHHGNHNRPCEVYAFIKAILGEVQHANVNLLLGNLDRRNAELF